MYISVPYNNDLSKKLEYLKRLDTKVDQNEKEFHA